MGFQVHVLTFNEVFIFHGSIGDKRTAPHQKPSGRQFHLEDSEIANNSDFFLKVNSQDYISRYRLLPIIPGNYLF